MGEKPSEKISSDKLKRRIKTIRFYYLTKINLRTENIINKAIREFN
jgi:hypothetical protein